LYFILLAVFTFSSARLDLSFASSNVKVGLYYYPWYTEGNGTGHWNGRREWTVVDTPVLGFYSSNDTSVIKQHLDFFKELDIDFFIVSWWGPHNIEIDYAVTALFEVVMEYAPWLNLTVMIEPFNEQLGPETYNFTEVLNYIYESYYLEFSNIWMSLYDKPLLCWFNGYNMTGGLNQSGYLDGGYCNIGKIKSDERFESRILGHNSYVDWYFVTPCSVDDSLDPVLSTDGFISVEPRYDDQYLGRKKISTYDEGLYDYQWGKVINLTKGGKVNFVAIYSWNEYHERSQIEPHINADGEHISPPFNKTKHYIAEIKQLGQSYPYMSLIYVIVGIVIGVLLTLLCIYKRRK